MTGLEIALALVEDWTLNLEQFGPVGYQLGCVHIFLLASLLV